MTANGSRMQKLMKNVSYYKITQCVGCYIMERIKKDANMGKLYNKGKITKK